ncbi:hypothetical protein AAY473_012234 [Plecturocebus cupreus]
MLAYPPLTSCYAAQYLTGHGPVPVHGPGFEDPILLYQSTPVIWKNMHFRRSRWADHLRLRVRDQPNQHGETRVSNKNTKLAWCEFILHLTIFLYENS